MSIVDLPPQPLDENQDRIYRGRKLSKRGEPVWELALSHPRQGDWTEEEYLRLTETEFVELVDGCLEFLPMADPFHQLMAQYFYERLSAYIRGHRTGIVLMAPCPVRLGQGHLREPDVLLVAPEQLPNRRKPPVGAELVMEVVSPGAESRQRDLVDKRRDYAQAGVSEYWIVDPETESVTVLALDGSEYRVHGEFKTGESATSVLLPGFAVDVSAVFAAGRGEG
jgi:Uma2 family endonuclease